MTTPQEPGDAGQPGENKPFEPMPAAPALNEQELAGAPQIPRPKAVDNAFQLWMIGAGLSLIGLILSLTLGGDALRDSLREGNRSYTEQDLDNAVNLSITVGVVVGLAFIGLYVLFAYKMRAGRNWARITLSVLGGLAIVFGLVGIGSANAVSVVVYFVQALLILGAVYFMYRPESNQYFNAARVPR